MLSRSKWFRCSVLAVASVAILALPSAASAHDAHPLQTHKCPTGTAGPVVDAVCFVLQGVEYAALHGGTVGAVEEVADNTEANAFAFEGSVDDASQAYATTMGTVGGAFKTAVETSTAFFEDAVDAGLVSAAVAGQTWADETADDTLGPPQPVNCPLNSVNPPVFQGTYGLIRTIICAQWAPLVAIPTVDTNALQQHLGELPGLLQGTLPPFELALKGYATALGNASLALKSGTETATGTLANVTKTAAETLAVEQIIETWYSAQCVRQNQGYGPYSRPGGPASCPQ